MGKPNRRTRRNAKIRKLESQIDEPQTTEEGNKAEEPAGGFTSASNIATSGIKPQAPANTQTQQAAQGDHDGEKGVRILVTAWRFIARRFVRIVAFLDTYNGAVTALATVAIMLLSGIYVHYSKAQWETMQRQLIDSEAAQSAQITIEDFVPDISEGKSGQGELINGNVVIKNNGATVAKEITGGVGYWESRVMPKRCAEVSAGSPSSTGPSLAPQDTRPYAVATQIGDWSEVDKGAMFFGYDIAFSYRNVFGQVMTTYDCFMYDYPHEKFVRLPTK